MNRLLCTLVAVLFSTGSVAGPSLLSNHNTPYPAHCGSFVDYQHPLGRNPSVKVFEGRVSLLRSGAQLTEHADAILQVYRITCSEDGRSMIGLQFTMPTDEPESKYYVSPLVRALLDDGRAVPMTLVMGSQSWTADAWPWTYPQVFGFDNCEGNGDYCTASGWYFLLDNVSPLGADPAAHVALTPTEYNGDFRLELNWAGSGPSYIVDIPATREVVDAAPRIPLSGRLSGNWVMEGAADQGLVLAISELAEVNSVWTEADPFLLFLSWYTYDLDGNPLWLTGAARFTTAATEVSIPLERVTNGAFLADKVAERSVVGTVKLTAYNCNDLGIDYDLSAMGLGSGTKHLERLFSLETAGYVCRDLEARVEANQ